MSRADQVRLSKTAPAPGSPSCRLGRTDGSENWSYELYVMDALGEVGPLVGTWLTNDTPDPDTSWSMEDSQVTWSPMGRGSPSSPPAVDSILTPATFGSWTPRTFDGDGFGDHFQQLTFDETFNCDAFEDMLRGDDVRQFGRALAEPGFGESRFVLRAVDLAPLPESA